MNKFASILAGAVALSLITPAAFAAEAERNDRLYDANGTSIAKVNRVAADGDVVVIYKGKVRRVQSETLSNAEGKLITSLTAKEVRRLK